MYVQWEIVYVFEQVMCNRWLTGLLPYLLLMTVRDIYKYIYNWLNSIDDAHIRDGLDEG